MGWKGLRRDLSLSHAPASRVNAWAVAVKDGRKMAQEAQGRERDDCEFADDAD
jgi:hypothetical protein